MSLLTSYLAFIARLLRPLSLCGHIGGINGAIVGGLMGLFFLGHPHLVLSVAQVIPFGLILALFVWVIMLVVLCAWERYSLSSVAVPTFINAVATSLLTVFLTNYVRVPILAWLVGAITGMLVGELLCRLCGLWSKSRLEKANAVHR